MSSDVFDVSLVWPLTYINCIFMLPSPTDVGDSEAIFSGCLSVRPCVCSLRSCVRRSLLYLTNEWRYFSDTDHNESLADLDKKMIKLKRTSKVGSVSGDQKSFSRGSWWSDEGILTKHYNINIPYSLATNRLSFKGRGFKSHAHTRLFKNAISELTWMCYWWFWNIGKNRSRSKVKVTTHSVGRGFTWTIYGRKRSTDGLTL